MERFARRNELFERLAPVGLPALHGGELADPATWQDAAGKAIGAIQADPVGDFITRDAIPAGDLSGLFASITPNRTLVMCAQVRSHLSRELTYVLRATAIGPQGVTRQVGHLRPGNSTPQGLTASGHFACFQVSMDRLGNPNILFLGAEVRGPAVGIIDQTAWQMALLSAPDQPAA